MKLSEQSIRKYIRRLIMETFYVGNNTFGAMTKDQVEKIDPTFFDSNRFAKRPYGDYLHQPGAPPADVPGESENFGGAYDTRLISAARQDFEDADPEHIRKLGTLMYSDPNILKSITFSDEDAAILPDITDQNEEGLRQGLELLYIIGDGFYDYMTHIYDLKDQGFGDFMRRQKSSGSTARGVGDATILGSDYPLQILFQPVQEGQIGMGRSLMDRIDRIIISALSNLSNMTPIEFRDTVYPALESVIRRAYDRMPHIQRNLPAHGPKLDDALEAYLESIHYVLGELIGEINFEYTYDTVDDTGRMIFIPSDPEVRKRLEAFGTQHSANWFPKDAVMSKVASVAGADVYPNALRDLTDYYDMKFSVNPQEIAVLQDQSRRTLDWRMNMNLTFAVGLEKFDLDPDDYGIDMWEVGEKLYQEG